MSQLCGSLVFWIFCSESYWAETEVLSRATVSTWCLRFSSKFIVCRQNSFPCGRRTELHCLLAVDQGRLSALRGISKVLWWGLLHLQVNNSAFSLWLSLLPQDRENSAFERIMQVGHAHRKISFWPYHVSTITGIISYSQVLLTL